MRISTTTPEIGNRYIYQRTWVDVVNGWLMPARYPTDGDTRWVTDGAGGPPLARRTPPSRAVLTVTETNVTCVDGRGRHMQPTNLKGRGFVAGQDDDGTTYVPVDPQLLYPLERPPVRTLKRWSIYLWVTVIVPLALVGLFAGPMLLVVPPADSDRLTTAVMGAAIFGCSLVVVWVGARQWWHIRAAQKADGTWSASVKAAMWVGAALAIGTLIKVLLGEGP
jgi:hypothetical protein